MLTRNPEPKAKKRKTEDTKAAAKKEEPVGEDDEDFDSADAEVGLPLLSSPAM